MSDSAASGLEIRTGVAEGENEVELRVGTPGDALTASVLRALHGRPLMRFLSSRRWYGAKGESTVDARFDAVTPFNIGGREAALTRVIVDLEGGRTAVYQLPLIAVPRTDQRQESEATLAVLRSRDGRVTGALVDATSDPEFRSWLGDAIEKGTTVTHGEASWVLEPIPGADVAAPDVRESRVVASEQSNTSIIYGDRAILKLFRRLETGENPDVEISRFLTTHTEFRNTPLLLGVAHVGAEAADRTEGDIAVTGMLQSFVAGATDAFEYAVDRASEAISDQPDRDAVPFAEDADRLGTVTRELHTALASAVDDRDFVPRIADRHTVQRWSEGAVRSMTDACDLLLRRLDEQPISPSSRALARALLDRRDDASRLVNDIVAAIGDDAGLEIRHHGDYHLGQVLRAPDGDFMIIDFEGEPARSIRERRARHSALRDVAGMLRSFAYAAAMAAPTQERASGRTVAMRRAQWEEAVRKRFLDSYFNGVGATFLPRERAHSDRLLSLFELEKVFYEVTYEMNNRPEWVAVPLTAAARLVGVAVQETA